MQFILSCSCDLCLQIETLLECVLAETGDKFLSMLPSWHAYERANEYYIFTRGVKQIDTNVKNFKVSPFYFFLSFLSTGSVLIPSCIFDFQIMCSDRMICGGINHISFILFLQSMKCYIGQCVLSDDYLTSNNVTFDDHRQHIQPLELQNRSFQHYLLVLFTAIRFLYKIIWHQLS